MSTNTEHTNTEHINTEHTNTDNDDDCVNVAGVCKVATCGDGYVHAEDEECDDGNEVDDDGCRNDCTLP